MRNTFWSWAVRKVEQISARCLPVEPSCRHYKHFSENLTSAEPCYFCILLKTFCNYGLIFIQYSCKLLFFWSAFNQKIVRSPKGRKEFMEIFHRRRCWQRMNCDWHATFSDRWNLWPEIAQCCAQNRLFSTNELVTLSWLINGLVSNCLTHKSMKWVFHFII